MGQEARTRKGIKGGDHLEYSNFKLAISEISPSTDNPLTATVKFIFADNQPNENHEGVKADEFDNIIRTAIYMPMLIELTETGVGDHTGDFPIGVIRKMEKNILSNGVVQLIGEGVLWEDEFSTEVNYLMKSFNNGNPPGISWELTYEDSVVENGVNWLKSVSTLGASFVGEPAYGDRTRLLSLSSEQCPICGKQGATKAHSKNRAKAHRNHYHSCATVKVDTSNLKDFMQELRK